MSKWEKIGIYFFSFISFLLLVEIPFVTADATDIRLKVRHINAYEALELHKSGRLILVDVHPGEGKSRSEIVGAFYIPSDKLIKMDLRLLGSRLIGLFCQ